MARRIEVPGGIHHVTARGNLRRRLFYDERDYHFFLLKLGEAERRFAWERYAACLMPNHCHLLVRTPQPNLGAGMLLLNGSYARYFNTRHQTAGHVYEGPYRSRLVAADEHLLEAMRYIVLNPVRAGLVLEWTQWPWTRLSAERVDGLFGSADEFAEFCNQVATRTDQQNT
jgi:REP element-mobilizing transposase RayT